MACSQFKQQRLPSWQPLLSPSYVSVLVGLVALICLPTGFIIAKMNASAHDVTIRYDHINRCSSKVNQGAFQYATNRPDETYSAGCITEVSFELAGPMKAPVFLYYGLTKFYQNHRRFSVSKSDSQLAGGSLKPHLMYQLAPMAVPGDLTDNTGTGIVIGGKEKRYRDFVYAPAGLIPWSMFNDTFILYKVGDGATRSLMCNGSAFSRLTNEPLDEKGNEVVGRPLGFRVGCRKKGIAWETDVVHKYKPLDFPADELDRRRIPWSAKRSLYGEDAPQLLSNDTYFNQGWYANEPGHAVPVTTDEDLMVWARVASLPTFRKLYRVIEEDMPAGKYVMRVEEHFDVASFDGEKSFTLATLSRIGGKNEFLATLYIVVGAVAAVAAVLLMVFQRVYGTRAEKSVAMLVAE